LTAAEINRLVRDFTAGRLPRYQMAAWLMAVWCRGLTDEETHLLTQAMADSGRRLDFSLLPGTVVDKHSTGGVGDKTTLVVAPLVAAGGAPVVKLSGRRLGHTGGTINKLESIRGFRTDLSPEEMVRQVGRIGVAIAAQSDDLAPADKRIYALREATATVDSRPLIASSVMSKKLAGGAGAIVLDVKVGRGAFMQEEAEAKALARLMVNIGERAGRRVRALVTGMNQPLGRAVGDGPEVAEAVATLRGEGPPDLTELCVVLAAHMLALAGRAKTVPAGRRLAEGLLHSGAALARWRELVRAQGGEMPAAETDLLSPAQLVVTAPAEAGVVSGLDPRAIGWIARRLAGPGERDRGAGLILAAKVGDRAAVGDPLAVLHARDKRLAEQVQAAVLAAYEFGETVQVPPLVRAVL